MEAFKDQFFNKLYLDKLAGDISLFYPEFDADKFLNFTLDANWNARELKDRMHWITHNLRIFLSDDYEQSIDILTKTAAYRLTQARWGGGDLIFPDFVEQYGLSHYTRSVKVLELFTRLSTAEFAIRPFIHAYPEKMMKQMLIWATHPDEHVRRLASEGCRPRLPWGMVLKGFVENPCPIFPILELLFHDTSEYVRKSVSNNLNDISKDNPKEVLAFCKKIRNGKPETERIIKHGLRTLLKNGNQEALNFFEFSNDLKVKDLMFSIDKNELKIGDTLQMKVGFSVSEEQKVRLEYKMYFARPGGKFTSRLFQWTERKLDSNAKLNLIKNHSFTDLSIRKHFPGAHRVELYINGKFYSEVMFHLKP